LVGAGDERLGGAGDDRVRPAEIGKALPQIHGAVLDGERRHPGEDVDRHVREERVHRSLISLPVLYGRGGAQAKLGGEGL
jgi:hypothetical protein